MRQIMSWNEDRDRESILQRQAQLIEAVESRVPEYGGMNGVVGCYCAHEG